MSITVESVKAAAQIAAIIGATYASSSPLKDAIYDLKISVTGMSRDVDALKSNVTRIERHIEKSEQ